MMTAVPSPESAEKTLEFLTSAPHVAGTEGSLRVAEYVRDELQKSGWDAQLVRYWAWMPQPVELKLEMVEPGKMPLARQEEPIAETALRPGLDHALGLALEGVELMRQAEGQATRDDMEGRLSLLAGLLDAVAVRSAQVPQEWQVKLRERIARLTQEMEFDPARVAQEVALFADRCDISEELARFRSHLGQFHALMTSGESVGRQLDFLVQELNRETNTIGSKSNDAELARSVVTIKSELEKIREQIQNIE